MFLRELIARRERIVSVSPSVTVRVAAQAMAEANVGCTAVVDANKLVGILTERDLVRRVLIKGLDSDKTRVSDVMTKEIVTAKADDHLGTATRLMRENHVRHLPIVNEKGALLGVLSIRDLLREEIQSMRDYIVQAEG